MLEEVAALRQNMEKMESATQGVLRFAKSAGLGIPLNRLLNGIPRDPMGSVPWDPMRPMAPRKSWEFQENQTKFEEILRYSRKT